MSLKKMQLKGGLTRTALLGVVLIGVLAGALVLARRGPAVLAKTTELPAPLVIAATPVEQRVTVSEATTTKKAAPPAASKAAAAPPAAKPSVVRASATPAARADLPAPAVAETLEVISLTGCLQHDEGTFRLNDTAGADAPKARSWKSGFLKKHPASVEIVDSANRLGLPTHVGQRVTVTGVMLNKEMRARAVQRLGVCS
jgi:hypothetical protein